ncbi:hypothetical protein DOTSEDRAFT_159357 [Dothistroma septosporum NZE10]|uniref:ZW10 C-terminal helical domain-containing protein n=1 Tax=Dothistroma septosporum (strain NZE10 / CBS 128990) TaxID=675120 RepID=M2YJT6_DOTSN|nr:hypothetical protein DOTSEDRAFT_159357 [Dothistroma septosporum NZE10]
MASAVISYIENGAYPTSEDEASANLTPSSLEELSNALQEQQDDVKSSIKSISKDASSDIDTWITRAKELQADILRSRETARHIVAEAEAGKELRAKADDRKKKVQLLEKEVAFQELVAARLAHIRSAHGALRDVQDSIVAGDLSGSLQKLEAAEESIGGIGVSEDSGVGALLGGRVDSLKSRLKDAVTTGWQERLSIDVEGRKVQINDGIVGLVRPAKGLGIFDDLVRKAGKDFDRAILRPRMIPARDGRVSTIEASGRTISCRATSEEANASDLIGSLWAVSIVLASNLPESVTGPLSEHLMPVLTTRLEERWLEPAVPIEIGEMAEFQALLREVNDFADAIERHRWHGSKPLRDWTQSAPRIWLTKRREALLGDVRNLVFMGLKEQKTVERVETQMVSKDDAMHAGDSNDEWDTAWDDPEEPLSTQPQHTDDEDEASAWDLPEDDETAKEEENGAGDAWGWGDGDPSDSPKATESAPPASVNGKPNEREVTLREAFTVTAVPDGLLELVQQVITDAQNLAGPEYADSPIAPASAALYTLPTLALAIYRATASTAYSRLENGNMLIYNDTGRLADQLRAWQAAQPPSSRLRLDNDVKALDQFAKKAYGAEMESQKTILRDFLDGAQGFSNCTTQPFKDECEGAIDQTVYRLNAVYRQWKPVLSQSALLQSIGQLVATVTGKMITEIEDLPDISEADSRELKALCDRISAVRDIFTEQPGDGAASAEPRDMTFIYCPNWLKFQYLAEIMESSLVDIKYLWTEGELSLEFVADEVEGLIEALFAESQMRRQAIQEIRRGGRR